MDRIEFCIFSLLTIRRHLGRSPGRPRSSRYVRADQGVCDCNIPDQASPRPLRETVGSLSASSQKVNRFLGGGVTCSTQAAENQVVQELQGCMSGRTTRAQPAG